MNRRRVVFALAVVVCIALVLGPVLGQWVGAQLPSVLRPPLDPLPAIGSLSAERCGSCHAEIKAEWAASHHGQAITDPLYRADLEHQGEPWFCNHCHAPLVEQQPKNTLGILTALPSLVPLQTANPRYDRALHQEGVTCVACHQRDGAIEGPRADKPAPHPVRRTESLGDGTVCEPCHSLSLTALGKLERPLMETFTEWREYRAKGGAQRCVDCHMPKVGERHSHKLLGPFDRELLERAIEVRRFDVRFDPRGADVTFTIYNNSGHRVPTAEPHRTFTFVFTWFDDSGLLGRRQVCIERPVNLETLVEAPGSDTTLHPREERSYELRLEGDGVTRVAVALEFTAWSPSDPIAHAAKMGHEALDRHLYDDERIKEASKKAPSPDSPPSPSPSPP